MTYPSQIDLKITLDSVDISSYVPRSGNNERGLPGIRISQEMGEAIDDCSFGMENAGALTLVELDELIITNQAETERYFAGVLVRKEAIIKGPEIDYLCEAQDYTVLLEKSIINQEWEDETDTTILSAIRTNADPALTDFDFTTHVTSVGTVPRLRLARKTVREALNAIAERVGADWYIDYDKKLHWFDVEDARAPYILSDSPDLINFYPYSGLVEMVDGLDVINRITVVGGDYLSGDIEHIYAGDGEQVRHLVPHRYQAQDGESSVIVEENTGDDTTPVWSGMTVGVKYLDDGGSDDVLWAFQERYFEFATAPANLKKSWRVKGRYEVPLRVRVRSQGSYEKYGRWYESVIVDDTIKNKEEARARGQVKLATTALGKTVYALSVYEPGLRAGQILELINGELSLNDEFLIRRTNRTFPGGGYIVDQVELGDYIPDLYALMVQASRAASEVEWREDEVLDELIEQLEDLELTEDSQTVSTSSGPYLWGSCDWGFAVWG